MERYLESEKTVTFSPSITLAVTNSCANHCLYCGFREKGGRLISEEEISAILFRARQKNCVEALVISGERVNTIESFRERMKELGFNSFVEYVADVCRKILSHGLLPHTNIGILDEHQMALLKDNNASMGLMLENSDRSFGMKVHPQKNIRKRIEMIIAAGRMKIPFTTGILVGFGEPRESRFESLNILSDISNRYGHIQEIILQNYVPNPKSRLPVRPLTMGEWKELVSHTKEKMPGITIQIPPNLNPMWRDLIPLGVGDLGGISPDGDSVNPSNSWREPSYYKEKLQDIGIKFLPRLPIYKEFYRKGWFSESINNVLEKWVATDEYRYYHQ